MPRGEVVRAVLKSLLAIALALLAASGLAGAPHEHPPIIDASKTRCEVCHASELEGAVVHPVVEDCQACHEISKVDGRSAVALVSDGVSLCLSCHPDLEKGAMAGFVASHAPVTDDCMICHEPHASEHRALLTERMPALCAGCHDADEIRVAHGVSLARADCGACHPPHGSDAPGMLVGGTPHPPYESRSCEACHRRGLSTRAKSNVSTICFACHAAGDFEGESVHTVARNGDCLSCHEPHSSAEPKLLRRSGQELCLACHDGIAKKLDAVRVHAAAPDACETCHSTHASAHPDLLVDSTPLLCGSCHDPADPELQSRHLGADMNGLECSGCHDAHGSTMDVLVADESVHPPFLDGCTTCHEESAAKLVAGGGRELCYACHGEIESLVVEAAHPHAALDMADCSDCHNPHASRNRSLVRAPDGAVCFGCHDGMAAEGGELQHGAIALAGCEACHEPHGGARARMLRRPADELCLGCHDGSRSAEIVEGEALSARSGITGDVASGIPLIRLSNGETDHPLSGHRALGVVTSEEKLAMRSPVEFEGEFHCVTCHDPHKGAGPGIFAGGTSDVCGNCHAK